MSDVFISYAREDAGKAGKLAAAFEADGLSVWWDRTIPAGKTFDQVIAENLAAARCVLVLWSSHSVGSNWVKEEAAEGRERGILVPVLVEPVQPPLGFRRIQAADLSAWKGERAAQDYTELLTAIREMTGDAAPSGASESYPPLPERRGLSRRHWLWLGAFAATLAAVALLAVFLRPVLFPVASRSPAPSIVTTKGAAIHDEFIELGYNLRGLFPIETLEVATVDGRLRLASDYPGVVLPALYAEPIVADFRAQFTVQVPAPVDGGSYGLIFRSESDSDNALWSYVLVGIRPSHQEVSLQVFQDGHWVAGPGSSGGPLQFEPAALNRVRVEAIGENVRVFVNGQWAAYYEGVTLTQPGQVGFYMVPGKPSALDAKDEVFFDDFSLSIVTASD